MDFFAHVISAQQHIRTREDDGVLHNGLKYLHSDIAFHADTQITRRRQHLHLHAMLPAKHSDGRDHLGQHLPYVGPPSVEAALVRSCKQRLHRASHLVGAVEHRG